MPTNGRNDLPLVAVVMSTYNGEKYLREQLDSILGQDYPRIILLIRDDGSTDGTKALLEQYALERPNVRLIVGSNIGVVPSFFECLKHVGSDAAYVAFSDQDDIWHKDKISRAVKALQTEDPDIPLLYFSERNYCDESLKNPSPSHLNKRGVSFDLSLFDNVCPGNTIVINREMLKLLDRTNPLDVYYHDWWMELLASCFGKVLYDKDPTLEYRRLESSVSPSGKKGIPLLSYRLHEFLSSNKLTRIQKQNMAFLDTFGSYMPKEHRGLLEKFGSGNRLRKATHPGRLRQTLGNEILLRACLLSGKL